MKIASVINPILLLFLLLCPLRSSDAESGCETPAGPNSRYEQLKCIGNALMDRHSYAQAADVFSEALEFQKFESPNFELLPDLALAYFRAGESAQALIALERAGIAVSVLAGTLRCLETDTGFSLIWTRGDEFQSPMRAQMASTMCGAAYEQYYVRTSLSSFLSDANLVKKFLAVQSEVCISSKAFRHSAGCNIH